ncbi:MULTISPECIES: sugar ABC transporter substrate-binding protein [Nocardioides]|uniref:Sugar ABC transporter substrate-binding protein n=1 Tax=Nocardioides vastitatis TaxID=2568655 RepID=A0ABW0ZNK0_9ACTN|nr:substrate-binding domain-containing protein [Nocardioides sp.]THI96769.1 sugar ABC transporter substrate-binding protein [Nocardioides sp.]
MQTSTTKALRRRRMFTTAVSTLALAALAACGASNGGTGGGGTTDKVDSSGIEKAQALYDSYIERPTQIPNKTPIDKPIPGGKKVTFISCGTPTCNLEADIIERATEKLDWSFSVIANDGTPEKTKAAWQQILREKPDGVIYSATPRAGFEPELQEAKDLGIHVTACCTTDPPGNGLDFVIGQPHHSKPVGQAMAAWVITNSKGSGNSVYVDISAFPILGELYKGYSGLMDDMCAACRYDRLDIPITALGKDVTERIVGFLRSHPDTKYVALSVDGALGVGLPAALKAAGLNDIKIVGEGPDTTTLQYISSGQQEATVMFPYWEEMFSQVDALARMFSGLTLEEETFVPTWIVTKDNLPTDEEIFPVVEDMEEQYYKLWGVA